MSEDLDRRIGRLIVTWLLPVLSAALSAALCLSVSERNADRGKAARADLQRTVCSLITALDDNYSDLPPTTELGRRNAATMSQLRTVLGCEPRSS